MFFVDKELSYIVYSYELQNLRKISIWSFNYYNILFLFNREYAINRHIFFNANLN
jgi:hypothetical protein